MYGRIIRNLTAHEFRIYYIKDVFSSPQGSLRYFATLFGRTESIPLGADLGFFKGGCCIKKMTRRVKARLTSGGFREGGG